MRLLLARPVVRVGGFLLGGLLLGCAEARDAAPEGEPPGAGHERPSLLLVAVDGLRSEDLEAHGPLADPLPRLRALASEGQVVSDYRCPEVPAIAEFSSLLSGRSTDERLASDFLGRQRGWASLGVEAGDRGWRTAAAVSTRRFSARLSGLDRGFERFEDARLPASGDALEAELVFERLLAPEVLGPRPAREGPLLLVLQLALAPGDAPRGWERMRAAVQGFVADVPGLAEALEESTPERAQELLSRRRGTPVGEAWRRALREQALGRLDRALGRIVDALARDGEVDVAVVGLRAGARGELALPLLLRPSSWSLERHLRGDGDPPTSPAQLPSWFGLGGWSSRAELDLQPQATLVCRSGRVLPVQASLQAPLAERLWPGVFDGIAEASEALRLEPRNLHKDSVQSWSTEPHASWLVLGLGDKNGALPLEAVVIGRVPSSDPPHATWPIPVLAAEHGQEAAAPVGEAASVVVERAAGTDLRVAVGGRGPAVLVLGSYPPREEAPVLELPPGVRKLTPEGLPDVAVLVGEAPFELRVASGARRRLALGAAVAGESVRPARMRWLGRSWLGEELLLYLAPWGVPRPDHFAAPDPLLAGSFPPAPDPASPYVLTLTSFLPARPGPLDLDAEEIAFLLRWRKRPR